MDRLKLGEFDRMERTDGIKNKLEVAIFMDSNIMDVNEVLGD